MRSSSFSPSFIPSLVQKPLALIKGGLAPSVKFGTELPNNDSFQESELSRKDRNEKLNEELRAFDDGFRSSNADLIAQIRSAVDTDEKELAVPKSENLKVLHSSYAIQINHAQQFTKMIKYISNRLLANAEKEGDLFMDGFVENYAQALMQIPQNLSFESEALGDAAVRPMIEYQKIFSAVFEEFKGIFQHIKFESRKEVHEDDGASLDPVKSVLIELEETLKEAMLTVVFEINLAINEEKKTLLSPVSESVKRLKELSSFQEHNALLFHDVLKDIPRVLAGEQYSEGRVFMERYAEEYHQMMAEFREKFPTNSQLILKKKQAHIDMVESVLTYQKRFQAIVSRLKNIFQFI